MTKIKLCIIVFQNKDKEKRDSLSYAVFFVYSNDDIYNFIEGMNKLMVKLVIRTKKGGFKLSNQYMTMK